VIVVDTNVITHFMLTSDRTEACERVYKHDPHWIAPKLWLSEFRNVLAIYVRKKIISYTKSVEMLEIAEALFESNTYDVKSLAIMQHVQKSTCSAYDLEFVSLAIELGVTLVTMDKQILREFPRVAKSPEDFA